MATNVPDDTTATARPVRPRTPSDTFERIITALRYPRRPRQDQAVTLAHHAVAEHRRIIVQAPTGVGKSLVALATAADAGRPGAPGIVVTATNSLGDQYLTDCRRFAAAAGFSYTRVMGASNYVCADSDAAHAAGVPGEDELAGDEAGNDNSREVRAERERWLSSKVVDGADAACRWELLTLNLDDDHRCPGYPGCAGGSLGGCGSKHARARGFTVDVVISNFHLLAYTHHTRLPLLPLTTAAVLIVDEAHELAETIAEIFGGAITEGTGSRAFSSHPELAKATTDWISASLRRVPWGNSRYDTAARVPVDLDGAAAFATAWFAIPEHHRNTLEQAIRVDPNAPAEAGDVLSLLRAFSYTALPDDTWRSWTERAMNRDTGAWVHTRTVTLRRVDSATRIVPKLLPAAAVLLTGTVGDTLPARLGLPDTAVHDLGQEFDWAKVRGRISTVIGTKTGDWKTQVLPRYRARTAELADAITTGGHHACLVLANAHDDVATITRHLQQLIGHRLFTQERGTGSLGAGAVKRDYVRHIRAGGEGVLIGSNSFATGLDLPGELCTFVAWWSCHRGVTGYYEEQVDRVFRGYTEERFRARFAQGVGRLLRDRDDHGEVMICDSRGEQHIRTAVGRIDQHLTHIDWVAAGQPA